jgi:hypothetical protein
MSVNSNPTESQQNMEKFPFGNFFSFIASVVDICDYPLLSNSITKVCLKTSKWL